MFTVKAYQWLNREKKRYYKITVDSFGEMGNIIYYAWGGSDSNRGGKKHVFVPTEDGVARIISSLMKRRKSRGYELIAPN